MEMHDCPRFDKCSAAICPLDPGWRKRVHARGDETCLYLRESQKPTRDEVFTGEQGVELLTACDQLFRNLVKLESESKMGMPRGTAAVLATARGARESGSMVLGGRRLLASGTVSGAHDALNSAGETA